MGLRFFSEINSQQPLKWRDTDKKFYKPISYIGGGGGNRTRVRKLYSFGSTCVSASIEFNCLATRRVGPA